jgi:hypothetical protein
VMLEVLTTIVPSVKALIIAAVVSALAMGASLAVITPDLTCRVSRSVAIIL